MEQFPITYTTCPKPRPDPAKLRFGRTFTDHMFLMDYSPESGWHNGRIVPYGPLELEPSAMVFHYGQEVFEGMKAYRRPDGAVQLFRPLENGLRLRESCLRMAIPPMDPQLLVDAVTALVKVDEAWVPGVPGASLYIRPFIIAMDPALGVHAAKQYLFCAICCPVGAYYPQGMAPVKIYVEDEDVRAVRGGTGYAKCGGNYGASIRAGERAEEKGYAQVLWLDGVERKYIEEVGAMNVMFKIAGEVVTPALTGSILPGITRRSCLDLLEHWGIPASERRISVEELFDAADRGELEEAWCTGTAAVISPIGELAWGDRKAVPTGGGIGELTRRLYDSLTGIQWGISPDPFGWTVTI